VVGRHPNGFMRKPPGHGVTQHATTAATPAPVIRLNNPPGQHRPIRLEALPGHLQTELIDTAEHRQAAASKGSVRHVAVFLMGCVRTPSSEDLDPNTRIPPRQALHPQLRRAGLGAWGSAQHSLELPQAGRPDAAGCRWLHVDFQEHLAGFYLDACRFKQTMAGLLRLGD
jgi:hypothetical protein